MLTVLTVGRNSLYAGRVRTLEEERCEVSGVTGVLEVGSDEVLLFLQKNHK